MYLWFVFYVFQIGKEHVGLKAVTEILQDIQYKVNHLKEVLYAFPEVVSRLDSFLERPMGLRIASRVNSYGLIQRDIGRGSWVEF